MKRMLVIATIALTIPLGLVAHETPEPHDEPAVVNQNANTAPATDETIDRRAAIARVRQPAALKPLLLVPLALVLYLVYERLAQRRRP